MAALLLLARTLLRQLGLAHPSAAEVLEATGSSKARAYELRDRLAAALPALVGPPGRPPPPAAAAAQDEPTAALSRAVLSFVMAHPGCAVAGPQRRHYADIFRHRVLELRERHPDLELERFAEAVGVPRPTLEDWLRAGRDTTATKPPEPRIDDLVLDEVTDARVQTVLAQYKSWRGDFSPFCDHIRHHMRLPLGNTSIATILFLHGERTPRRRPGRSPDEQALRDSFEVFFPGAQWVGDGAEVTVTINGECFTFNLELDVDAFSGAVVGASVRDTEDSTAVTEALRDGVATTGAPPLSLLLDNKPCNHTEQVDRALDATLRIRATPGRAQNKAHTEGAFGLFSQHAPAIGVHARDLHELARQMLVLRVQAWARSLNHRPRTDRGGNSRIQLYRDTHPSPEQIEAARAVLHERLLKQQRARQTRLARTDPLVRQLLDDAFERLELSDPERHIRSVIARYSRDVIVEAIAIFEGKSAAQRLPETADARYLLGIVNNLDHKSESEHITDALIEWRTKARDLALRALEQQRDELLASTAQTSDALGVMVDRALAADRNIDRHFWITAGAELIAAQHAEQHESLFRSAARRIHSTFRVDRRTRSDAERMLARKLWPVT